MNIREIEDKIQELEQKSSPLEPDAQERNRLLKITQSGTEKFLDKIKEVKAYQSGSPKAELFQIDGEQHSMEDLMDLLHKEVFHYGINPASGGHIGYIPGGGIYFSALGDFIADVSNEFAGMKFASPGSVHMEHEVLNWMKDLFGFPKDAVGNLASGGSIANLIALTAARDHHEIEGEIIPKSVIYLTKQTHHSVHKALRIIGLSKIILREVKMDARYKMDIQDLESSIKKDKAKGVNPFMIIGAAGSTDTGAIDKLDEIARVCKANGLWFHVDAAYGGFFNLLEEKKEDFKGIGEADSLVADPHKSLFLPYGVGAVLVRNKEAILKSHWYVANYMQDAVKEEVINPADVSPELTKHFRGLRIWLPLKLLGLEPFKACLREKIVLTHYFRYKLQEMGFQVGPEPDLSVSFFWYDHPKGNEFNERLMEEIHKDGSVFLSSTSLNGKFVIRMALLVFRTKKHTIDRALDMIERSLVIVKKEFA